MKQAYVNLLKEHEVLKKIVNENSQKFIAVIKENHEDLEEFTSADKIDLLISAL